MLPLDSCKQWSYRCSMTKWLEFSYMLGNVTFYRTSSFHRDFHSEGLNSRGPKRQRTDIGLALKVAPERF